MTPGVTKSIRHGVTTSRWRAPPLALRMLAGLHLATAATIRARILQTSDLRLRTAAAALGFQVR